MNDLAVIGFVLILCIISPIAGTLLLLLVFASKVLPHPKPKSKPKDQEPPLYDFDKPTKRYDFTESTKSIKPKQEPIYPAQEVKGSKEWIESKKIYMNSYEWNLKRKDVLERDNYCCQNCGMTGVPLDVHHITYPLKHRDVKLDQLIAICRECHTHIHQKHGYDYTTKKDIK
jgi:5-methylcytosine-specific restriction endonuclease McrA